jgi:hypothetical protein
MPEVGTEEFTASVCVCVFKQDACYRLVHRFLSCLLLVKNVEIKVHKCNLAVGLNWSGTWAVTVRDEYRLKVFINTVLQKISGPNRTPVKIEDLHDLYSMPNFKG